jgi:alcohol dehydrogenase (NADP+)
MASITTHKLNTGATIPAIGLGTWQDKDAQEIAVTEALKAGYRHIDTARMRVVYYLFVVNAASD